MVMWFVVPAVVLYGLIAALVFLPRRARRARYRVGQPWTYPPKFWTANAEGAHLEPPVAPVNRGDGGGARGDW